MKLRSFASFGVGLLALAGGPTGCSDGDKSGERGGGAGATGAPNEGARHLIVVTERESPEVAMQYLHVLDTWPEGRELAYDQALELGEFVNVQALGNAVFVHQPADATVRKLTIEADGSVGHDETMSFAAYGVTGYAGDMVYVSPTRAYFLDEAAGQLVVWNPAALEIVGAVELPEEALTRDGMAAQISRGVALDGEAFVGASWRDWEALTYYDAAAVGVFDATSDEPELRVIEDDRCASTVTPPFVGEDGNVYVVSDAGLGFDALANPTQTDKALCVLRLKPGAREFDPDFFVDLKEVLGSPGFYAAHPLRGGKLLVNLWAPEVTVSSVADPSDPSWYWAYPPYFEYAIVDLEKGTATQVTDIPRARVQWSITLRVDGDTFVQTYRDDEGSDLRRVDPDGAVTNVLSNPAATDVQYVGSVVRE